MHEAPGRESVGFTGVYHDLCLSYLFMIKKIVVNTLYILLSHIPPPHRIAMPYTPHACMCTPLHNNK
jgi:hypothetical protein